MTDERKLLLYFASLHHHTHHSVSSEHNEIACICNYFREEAHDSESTEGLHSVLVCHFICDFVESSSSRTYEEGSKINGGWN